MRLKVFQHSSCFPRFFKIATIAFAIPSASILGLLDMVNSWALRFVSGDLGLDTEIYFKCLGTLDIIFLTEASFAFSDVYVSISGLKISLLG